MLLKGDASALEWRIKAFLAQDKVAIEEINNHVDIHSENQKRFNLPSRLISKIFAYRMIFADAFGPQGFRGPAFAYAKDPDFDVASKSPNFWEKVIEEFFSKYEGMHTHSINLIREGTTTGRIVCPNGRYFNYSTIQTKHGPDWPRAQMLNHIVQGFSADYMVQVRKEFKLQLLEGTSKTVLLMNTVHDDIELDVDYDPKLVYNICVRLEDSFRTAPRWLKKNYSIDLNVPMAGEVKFGHTLYEPEMKKFNPTTFFEDYKTLCNS